MFYFLFVFEDHYSYESILYQYGHITFKLIIVFFLSIVPTKFIYKIQIK